MNIPQTLIEKYNVPAPRYTSYPTVPYWEEEQLRETDWLSVVKRTFDESNDQQGISLYIHLPYCESLCTYCACNTRITKNHAIEDSYIDTVLAEWDIYLSTFGRAPVIREIHLGGGTPTFFSAGNLGRLIGAITSRALLHPMFECSFEGHPNNTTEAHLEALYQTGARRVSFGVQDLDYTVQKTINRVQPFHRVKAVTEAARRVGYESVNFDLIYGLPFQTVESVENTIKSVLTLQPERIAFYSYAHVPWKRPGQRAYTESDLPDNEYKRALYETGKRLLCDAGYADVGMDHFALATDALYRAYQTKSMHRNFMGYTHATTDLLIGLGASSVSDAKYAYAQNAKHVEDYKASIASGHLALHRGHYLTDEDLEIKEAILSIICSGELCWRQTPAWLNLNMMIQLNTMHEEGLLKLYPTGLRVTELGMAFLRNICMIFDKRLSDFKNKQHMFSKAI